MGKTTIGVSNLSQPSPRWYRILKKIVYGIFATALFSSTLQRFGVTDADVTLVSAWTITIMETLGSILANGQEYRPRENEEETPAP